MNDRIRYYRILLLMGAILIPALGFSYRTGFDDLNDPIILRLIIGGLGILVLVLSFGSNTIKTRLKYIMYGFIVVIGGWMQYVVFANALNPNYAVGLIIGFVGMSLIFDDLLDLRIYISAFVVITTVMVLMINNPGYPQHVFLLQFFLIMIVDYVALTNYIKTKRVITESGNRFQTLVDSATTAYCLLDPDHRIVKINQKAKEIIRIILDTRIREGDDFKEYIHPSEIDGFMTNFNKSCEGVAVRKERNVKLRDDFSIWYDISYTPVPDIKGQTTHVLFSAKDITERKAYSRALHKGEQRFRGLFENAPIGMALCSVDGEILQVNRAFEAALGYKEKELLGRKFTEITSPEDLAGNLEHYQKALKGDVDHYMYEKRYIHKKGRPVHSIIHVSILKDTEGELEGFMVQVVDIDRIKRSEELLKIKNVELEKINAELDRFVYSAAHDLRSPLTSLLGLINVTRIENTPESTERYLNLMESSVKKLDRFIRDVMDYSRNSRMGIHVEEIDFASLIDKVFDNHSHLDQSLSITKSVDIQYKKKFKCDRSRLEIVLNNLISNSIKYYDPHKENPCIKILVVRKGKKVLIEVSDNGQGIKQDHLDKIFNIFYRGSERSQGSGLGLYIVKETIEKLGGVIDVESTLGVGTTFRLLVPEHKATT